MLQKLDKFAVSIYPNPLKPDDCQYAPACYCASIVILPDVGDKLPDKKSLPMLPFPSFEMENRLYVCLYILPRVLSPHIHMYRGFAIVHPVG